MMEEIKLSRGKVRLFRGLACERITVNAPEGLVSLVRGYSKKEKLSLSTTFTKFASLGFKYWLISGKDLDELLKEKVEFEE